jgi:hypothetical protein
MNSKHSDATIGHLFDLLLAPVGHSESEVADLLRIGVEPLRDRMKDLRMRGLLAGPFRDTIGTKWKLRYPTAVQARSAARKAGLDPDAGVIVGATFWIELGRQAKRVVGVASNSVRRWIQQ